MTFSVQLKASFELKKAIYHSHRKSSTCKIFPLTLFRTPGMQELDIGDLVQQITNFASNYPPVHCNSV